MNKKNLNISSNLNLSSDKNKYTTYNNIPINIDNSSKNHFTISSSRSISKKFSMNTPSSVYYNPPHSYLHLSSMPMYNTVRSINDNVKHTKTNYRYLPKENKKRTFYVCSYGGCGSYMLCEYLKNFGNIKHIHSRKPPSILSKITNEWFNNEHILGTDINNYTVIYIYKNPIKSIYSRFVIKKQCELNSCTYIPYSEHQQHVQCDRTDITIDQCMEENKDLFKLEEFFDNYTTRNQIKNYPIYCIKYEDFWENIELFNEKLNLPNEHHLYPIRRETPREREVPEKLLSIYRPLIEKMNNLNFIEIV
jgi:hypothetical protein